ncbi:phospholipase A2 precursor, putative, partial [Ixodes scapularis]
DTIYTLLNVIPQDIVTYVNQDEMQYFLDLCDNKKEHFMWRPLKSIFNFIDTASHSLVIFPGTKWCGAGDIAKNYDDLGRESKTDMCCRDHDHAYNTIAPYKTEHGLFNFQFFTMTNCLDDCKFYDCLLNVSSLASDAVGTIYFNTLASHCFAYGYPPKCVKHNVY